MKKNAVNILCKALAASLMATTVVAWLPAAAATAGDTGIARPAAEVSGRIARIHKAASILVIGGTEYSWRPTARVFGLGPAPVGLEHLEPGLLVRTTYMAPQIEGGRPVITSVRVLTE